MDLKLTGLKFASRIGVGDTVVSAHDYLTEDDLNIDPKIRNFAEPYEYSGRIFFPLFEGGSISHAFRTGILAHAFKTRGYKPYIVLCDASLDLCHEKELIDDTAMCDLCHTRGQNRLKQFGLDIHTVSDLLPDDYCPPEIDGLGPTKYQGIHIRDYALASSRRFLRKYSVDLANKNEQKVFKRFIRSAMITVDATRIALKQHSFDATVTHHPAYVIGGVSMEASENQGVPAYAHSTGYRKENIIFGMGKNRSPMAQFSDEKLIQNRMKSELTDSENKWVDEFMKKRTSGEDVRRFYADDTSQELSKVYQGMNVGLFTNLLWDASLSADNIVFEDPFEWLRSTINEFSSMEKNLIIKTHPAEKKLGTHQGVYNWIDKQFNLNSKELSNIKVLKPDSDINPYLLIEQLDAGIVYNSTVGMEMAYEMIPAVVVGDTHYRNLGFTFDIESQNQYTKLLTNIEELEMTEEMLDLTKRYLYFLFKECHINFQYHTYWEGTPNYNKVTHKDIMNDENLDVIVDCIINSEPVSYREIPSSV